ncbi:MAG TPA: cysteine hydrolase family protein [Trinickia sp.]|nr:cysteine hydrolase family protein [Trinickia sp.]
MSQATPRRALIVIDVQNEYVTGDLPIEYPDVNVSLANIGRAMDAARAASVPVVVVQNFAPANAPIFARGSEGGELHPVVASRPRDHFLEKSLPSAFTGTDLADWLKANEIDTLTVVGYMTHNCDASTINHALHAGFAVEFLSDATGSVPYENAAGFASAEEIHRVFSVVLQSRFAAVLGTDEWIAALASGALPQRGSIYASNQKARERRLQQKEAAQA